MTEPGLSGGNNAPAPARETPAQRLDPLDELRGDLAVVLRVLETRAPVALVLLGRRKANKFSHALEAAQREVRRALAVMGASAGSGSG
jgi:hypothetical protein